MSPDDRMTTPAPTSAPVPSGSFLGEAGHFWRSLPDKPLFLGLLAAWLALFQFFGNSTLGLVNTASLFGWWKWTIGKSPGEEHAYLMPLVTLGLLMWKSRELEAVPKRTCWPALALVALALMLHVVGYMIQQTRLSVVAFALGLYGLTGVVWGGRWLWATLFPFTLLLFSVPLGADIDRLTQPLRLWATQITAGVSHTVLGIPVVCNGTQLFSPDGRYLYDVAPACGGIRSLTAIIAFGVVFAFISLHALWRRLLIVASAVPLAVLGNVTRLTLIVMAAELFGQKGGNYVHENGVFSLAPYVPAILGMLFLGYWLDEERKSRRRGTASGAAAAPVPGGTPQVEP
jgi:exosortase